MKKNILTIIIMAIVLINTILTAVLIFAIVPAANKTTKLVDKVASIVDLELESPEGGDDEFTVTDIETYDIADKLTINLKSIDGVNHFALVPVSIYLNTKNANYTALQPKIGQNENKIKEIVTEEVAKYSMDEVIVTENKDLIKKQILVRLQEYFQSDFIIDVSFGNIILQ